MCFQIYKTELLKQLKAQTDKYTYYIPYGNKKLILQLKQESLNVSLCEKATPICLMYSQIRKLY